MEDYAGEEGYYFEDDEYHDDDLDICQVPMINAKGPSVEVITKESLLAKQREELRKVMDLLLLKEHHARTLLIHYRWDIERMLAVFVEQGKEQLYSQAGVAVVEDLNLTSLQFSSEVTCTICYEDVSADKITRMDCGHYFCNDCWTSNFIIKINEGQSKRIKCMADKCSVICDEAKVRILVSENPNLAEKFDHFLLESYIEDNKMVKWCPSAPHCGNAIRVKDSEFCEVECSCGFRFCFSCLSEVHSPCSCLMWQRWSQKCQDESETVNWITANTMWQRWSQKCQDKSETVNWIKANTNFCPKCHKSVEKNGGCNHVTCVCGQSFCWLCGGATGKAHSSKSIEDHSCRRYTDEEKNKMECAKEGLTRYIHYHSRYKAHTDSLKLESKLKDTIQEKISHLENRDLEMKDFSWVTSGLHRLFRCRQILSHSYPFAYYMFGDDLLNQKMSEKERNIKQYLFEYQQQLFETHVEKLSLFLEELSHLHSQFNIKELRQKFIDLSTITDQLCRNLYDCIEEDLLDPIGVRWSSHCIAPYKSDGIEKAS